MIWGHDPPRTHEKITGKTESFRAFCFCPATQQYIPFSGSLGKRRRNIRTEDQSVREILLKQIRALI